MYVIKPKKPNSALRKIIEVIKDKKIYKVYVPGEKGDILKHTSVLFYPKSKKDCPGINYYLIRGALDSNPVPNRKTSRSKYGTKKN